MTTETQLDLAHINKFKLKWSSEDADQTLDADLEEDHLEDIADHLELDQMV